MTSQSLHQRSRNRRLLRSLTLLTATLALPVGAAACGSSSAAGVSSHGVVQVVAAENEYGDVAAQVGGRYVHVVSVESNPNTDPHTYEVSPRVASEVSGAGLVIQNGVGYDTFMNKIESASPRSTRRVIDVQQLLGPARQHPQSPPVVRPEDHAGGGQGHGRRPRRPRSRSRRLLPGQRGHVRLLAAAVAPGHRRLQGQVREVSGRPRRSRSPTTSSTPWGSTTSRPSDSRPTS